MRTATALGVLAALLTEAAMADIPVVDTWRYTFRKPANGWEAATFDDSSWRKGPGGFGTRRTPGARMGTHWDGKDIWLRKTFAVTQVPQTPALLIHHDEDAEVYINGRQVAGLKGYIAAYRILPLPPEHRDALRTGGNTLAVHCRQTTGGQFIDVHVVDADNVPELPPGQRNTKPFSSHLITPWGEALEPTAVWSEYPRPQLVREAWQNLNGPWDYAVTPREQTSEPSAWTGKILVPYCIESKLSGVHRLLDESEALWYRRSFRSQARAGQRTLLHFEAVDYSCEVTVNGKVVGGHRGGHTPFHFDVSSAIRDGDNELVVRVEDATEGWQLRGKQVLEARSIWYTQVSGIWQTVWLEQVSDRYISDLKIATDAKAGTIAVRPVLGGQGEEATVRLTVRDGDDTVADMQSDSELLVASVPTPKLWSPTLPHLYDLELALLADDGTVIDRVASYAGIRTVGKVRGKDGHLRFTLNGEEIFHWGPLDQGWWPDSLLTPPSDEAMLYDIEFLREAGFNMIRKHIKVEPRRYYCHCDRLGMMVWQDQVSGGRGAPWTRLKPNPKDAVWPEEHHAQYMLELERMIDTLENHPSIVVWVPFNEAWGQHRTVDVGRWTVERDPSRLVNIASGGNFWPVGDVVDAHIYPHPGFPFQGDRYRDYIKVVGEFGGHGYPVRTHLWDANGGNWGYGGLPRSAEEYRDRYATSIAKLNELRAEGIAGGVYTQTTDVEGEINGLMTYDRKVTKIPAPELARLHAALFVDPPARATPDIWTAASQGDLEAIRKHLAAGTDVNATSVRPGVPGSGGAPLHVAVMAGKLDAAKLLLEEGASVDVKADDEHKGTPLHWAAFFGRLEFVKLLVVKGADVNAAASNGYTPLDAARHQEDWMPDKTEVVAFLRGRGGKPRGDAPAGDNAPVRGRPAMGTKLHVNDAAREREASATHEAIHPAWSQNWPQFRGPDALGVSANAGLPDKWSATDRVVWRTPIPGRGWSSPVVWGNRIFVTTAIKEGELEAAKPGLYFGGNRPAPKKAHRWVVYGVDLDSGRIAWEREVHRGVAEYGHHVKGSMASETAVCDADRVYAYIGNVGMFCFDHVGNALWEKRWDPVPTRFGWGTAASPVLHGDRVYVVNDNEEQSFLVALDRKTGEWIWRADRDEGSNWATPFVWENEERTEIITPGTGKVRSYGLDGELLWELGKMSSITIPTPFAGHGLLYVTSGYVGDRRRPLFAVRPGATGDITLGADETRNTHIAWCQKQAGPYNVSPILYGDYVYVLYDRGFLACYDARTGQEIYGKRRIAPDARAFTSSPWAYGGKIFCLSEKGDTYVVRAGPAFELLGKNSLGELCMATPAIAGNRVIIRTESSILCVR